AVLRCAARRPSVLVIQAQGRGPPSIAEELERTGIKTHVITDPGLASATLKEEPVDVCVVDMASSRGQGPELISGLRGANPELAVIAITADSELPLPWRNIAGVTYLRRPFLQGSLARAVALERSRRTT